MAGAWIIARRVGEAVAPRLQDADAKQLDPAVDLATAKRVDWERRGGYGATIFTRVPPQGAWQQWEADFRGDLMSSGEVAQREAYARTGLVPTGATERMLWSPFHWTGAIAKGLQPRA